MIFEELRNFLIHGVLTSWQVIVVVLVAILYIALVSYTARFRRRISDPPVKKATKPSNDKKPAKTSDVDTKNEKDRKKNKS